MSLKDLTIKHSYKSYGADEIAKDLINPCLQEACLYERSVGYFSSSALLVLLDGILGLVRNNGKIKMIASPNLTENDVNAIQEGYQIREQLLSQCFTVDFSSAIEVLDDAQLKMLLELIANNYMDIKIAITKGNGMYHDKLGIIRDKYGNAIAFYGSSNESYNGYCENYEKVRVVRNWMPGEKESVNDEQEEFDNLWNDRNLYVDVYDYTECAHKELLRITAERASKKKDNSGIELRDYQNEAIQAWVNNQYHGFFVMATGTGKTWTAIYAAVELLKQHKAVIVICAPYKHLVKQWAEDVQKVFPNSDFILVSSENPTWENQIKTAIIKQKYDQNRQIIIISTIKSFYKRRFIETISKSRQEKLLIVDEAHRFTKYSDSINHYFQYMLGLSATPFSGSSQQKGKALMAFFGGCVYNLPIEKALELHFLVPYYYYPIIVYATAEEEEQFNSYSSKIMSCFKNNVCIDPEQLSKYLRARLRIISMAEEKINSLDEIFERFIGSNHFIVYCGDGRLFDGDHGEELRHIQYVKNKLTALNFRVSQFTAKENISERMQLVDAFNHGDIDALAAIRCLDEGINIPSIDTALILSSNNDYREFVQRRGRILRTYGNKKYANIYDIMVLPSSYMTTWAQIEFKRYYEYARLAINREELLEKLTDEIRDYGLTIEDLNFFDSEDLEDVSDE